MSKRFGRQQKKQLKQQLLQAENSNKSMERSVKRLNERNDQYIKALEIIYDANPYSPVFKPMRVNSQCITMCSDVQRIGGEMMDVSRIDLHALDVEVHKDEFQRKMHALVVVGGERFGYACSYEAVRHINKDAFVDMVAIELYRSITGR